MLLIITLAWILGSAADWIGVHSAIVEDIRAWPRHVYPLKQVYRPCAVALAVDDKGRGVVAKAIGYDDLAQAEALALRRCEELRGVASLEESCALYSRGGDVVWDFSGMDVPTLADTSAEECLARPEVEFYLFNMWLRTTHTADFSFSAELDLEYELELDLDGSLRRVSTLRGAVPELEERARRALVAAGPFGPLFGPLSCLSRGSFKFRFADPRQESREPDLQPL